MEITDEVHWGDVFERNGTPSSYSMSRKSIGTWKVQKDDLCVDRGKDDGGSLLPGLGVGEESRAGRERRSLCEGVLQRPRRERR